MKIVLFLGAGFSRAWGLPVMQEFFQYANDSTHLKEDDKNFLRELRRESSNANNAIVVRYDNLEEILSYCLASTSFNAGYPNKEISDYDKLCHILQEVYRHIDNKINDKYKQHFGRLRRLFGMGKNETGYAKDISIITTNYDVMLEYSLARFGWHCNIPCEWDELTTRHSTNILYSTNKSGPLLCKLHGSLNWFSPEDNKNIIKVENSIQSGEYFDSYKKGLIPISLPRVCLNEYNPIGTPLIIPPTLFKMQTDPRFSEIWSAAGKALNSADKLVFIGFSFPDSDIYIKYFLAANLSDNVDLRPIEIIDPKASEICKKLKDSNFGPDIKNRLTPIDGKWEELNYSILV